MTDVVPGSPAARTGLRVAGAIEGLEYVPGNGDVRARLTVRRGGKLVEISYLPHGEKREGARFVWEKGARDDSCAR